MKTLVTGGFGYFGSRLLRYFAEEGTGGRSFRVLDNLQRGAYGGLMGLPQELDVEFLEGDILDPGALHRALQGIDEILHLAAIVKTPFSFDHPSHTEAVNHWGTSRLVQEARESGVTRFVFASSTSVYGTGEEFDEDSPIRPVGPYSVSKANAERAVLEAGTDGFRVTVLRIGTIYGFSPCMRFEAVPNRFAYLAALGRPITVFGGGGQVRPIVHIRDACAAISLAANESQEFGGITLNVVSSNQSVLDMARLAQPVKDGGRITHTAHDLLTHISLRVSSERLRALGWAPKVNLEEGIREVMDNLGPFAPLPRPDFGLALED